MTKARDLSQVPNASLGFKNRIINGAMMIDQRNTGASISSTAFVVDRFLSLERSGYTTLAVTSQQQTSDVPANFSHAVKLTVGTGQAVSSSGNLNILDQRIEGFNFADFGFGTANARPFTMSFWVKSSIAGTYPVSFFNSGVSRAYLATYTINSANTWEYKTITVVGDTSGTWNTGNGIGLGFQMAVSAGSNNFGTPGSWSGTYKNGVSGMPDLGATTGATMFITGVQLEKGSTATSFDYRPYGTELQLCQRYYEKSYNIGTAPGAATFLGSKYGSSSVAASTTSYLSDGCPLKVTKRAIPTITVYDSNGTSGKVNREAFGVSSNSNSNAFTSQIGESTFLVFSDTGVSSQSIAYQWTASAEL